MLGNLPKVGQPALGTRADRAAIPPFLSQELLIWAWGEGHWRLYFSMSLCFLTFLL